MPVQRTAAMIAFLAVSLVASGLQAAVLQVDLGATGQDVQSGFQAITQSTSAALPSPLSNGTTVTVGLTGIGQDIEWRNRNQVTHSLGDLLEDFAFTRGSRLNLTLRSLKPGGYTMTAYFHDTDFGWHAIDLSASDALGTERSLVQGLTFTRGATPLSVSSVTFPVFSNGVDPVVVHGHLKTAGDIVLLNGFELVAEETLRVDFANSIADTTYGHDVQNGFFAFARTGDTSGAQSETYASGLGLDGAVTVKVAPASGTLQWRDRGNSNATELPDLAEDFVFHAGGLTLMLEDLQPNVYLLTTYHHDTTYSVSPLNIDVTDAWGTNRLAVAGLNQTVSTTGEPARASFLVKADGIHPVVIGLTNLGDPSTSVVRLNGFSLTVVVPEPGTGLLLALGLLALVGLRRKRR